MSFRDKLRKLKSDAKSRIFQADEAKGANNSIEQPLTSNVSNTPRNWTYLRLLLKSLDQTTKPLSPLKAAVIELSECINIFESVLHGRREYEALYNEFETLFQTLQTHCIQNTPPVITATIESLCKSLEDEVSRIRKKQSKGKVREYLEADQDAEELLACYQRVYGYLQRVSLNIDLSIWRTVDEIAIDNRLKHLSPSLSARFNSAQAIELKRGPCTQNTRVNLLSQILGWVDGSSPGSIYWMNGMAGTGKTTIAYSLCIELEAKQQLAANFFCSRVLPECRDINLIIPSIAYQLARFSSPFRFALSGVLEKDPDVHTQLPHIQFNSLIAQPLLQVKPTLPDNLVIVVDALDECDGKESTSRMIEILLAGSPSLPIKIVISSRPEPEIRDEMVKQNNQASSRVVLHELDKHVVQLDIETYLRAAMSGIQLTEEQIAILVERAGILFIYAATVVRYIGHDRFRRNPRARLANILEPSGASENGHKEIDELYTIILKSALDDPTLDHMEREDMRQVLHSVICAQEPLTVDTLSRLLHMNDTDRVRAALRPLWSVLHVAGANELVTTLHASFPDYMVAPSRSKQYYCDVALHNQTMARLCFDCLGDIRRGFNICGLESSYVPDDKVEGLQARVGNIISAEVSYASRYWGTHLHNANGSPDLNRQLEEFLSKQLLLWMEVMNLKKCAYAMPQILWLIEKEDKEYSAKLSALIHDAWRFTSAFALNAVSDSTPHIYTSMLPLWPESSPVTQYYTRRMERTVRVEGTAVGQRQHALLATWTFDPFVCSPRFSPDGTQITAGIGSKVYLVNSLTGRTILPPFEGHSDNIISVEFSPDGTRIVSSSYDNTIRVWSTLSGKIVAGPFVSHAAMGHNLGSIAFSPDGTRLVSASITGVRILDSYSGRLKPAEQNLGTSWTGLAKYSPDGHYILIANKVIQICDAHNGQPLRQLGSKLYNDDVEICTSFDISPDGTRIATGSSRNCVYILDFKTGQVVLGPLNMDTSLQPGAFIYSVSFSRNGSYLVCGSSSGICTWDTRNGSLVFGPLERGCSAASFSPNSAYLISSFGKTLRLWDTRSTLKTPNQPRGEDKLPVMSVGFSPDGARVLSRHTYNIFLEIFCFWDVESGELVLELLGQDRGRNNTPVAFSPEGSHLLMNTDRGLVFIDAQTGISTRGPVRSSQSALQIGSAAFSPDGRYIVFGELGAEDFQSRLKHYHPPQASNYIFPDTSPPRENIARILEVETGQTSMVIHLPPTRRSSQSLPFATFSSDGAHIITHSTYDYDDQHIFCVYDARSGRLLHDRLRGDFFYFTLSPDGTRLISYYPSDVVVYDVRSGEHVLGPLDLHKRLARPPAFSADGRHIVCADDHDVCIWDAQTGQLVFGPAKWHTEFVASVAFSPDGTRVVSSSSDSVIRVTDIRAAKIPDPTLQTIGEWQLREDGWVVDELSRLLIWIPSDLRASLLWPRTKLLISPKGDFRLNFTDAFIGESWAKSYQPV